MVFVQQSADGTPCIVWLSYNLTPIVSILQAIYEICLKRGWAVPTRVALDMCKMVEKRMFVSLFLLHFHHVYHI